MRAVLQALPDAEALVLGCGPTLDLCRDLTIVEVDVRRPGCLAAHERLLAGADLYVAFSNNTNIPEVVARGLPLAFVDIHFEMKRRDTLAMREARAYVIESHPGVEASLARWRPAHPMLVGPIIVPGVASANPTHPMLVNVGGASSPHIRPGVNTEYPARVTELVDRVAGRRGLQRVPVAMGSAAAATAPKLMGAAPTTLAPEAYRARLEASRLLLTAPGLNAPMEAFARGIPVLFLPPQNLTQVAHLNTYAQAGLAPAAERLLDLVPGGPIDMSAPEAEGTARVLEALDALGARGWREVEAVVEAQLHWSNEALIALAARQRAWWSQLGEPGAAAAAAAIRRAAR